MKKEDLFIYDTPEELANEFANKLMSWVENHSGNKFHLAISGGKTPDLLFAALSEKYTGSPLWEKIHFWWVDERMVPPTHAESNFGVVKRLLFSKIPIPEESIHRIKGENNPDSEAISYSAQITENLLLNDGWPVFDLILLGMGDDGHTASIFPDQMHLLESKWVCEVGTHTLSGQERVTLTGKVINSAANICFLVTGKGKAQRLNEIMNLPDRSSLLPAYHIRNANWYIDMEAAKLIR